jgi:hypothetical protein
MSEWGKLPNDRQERKLRKYAMKLDAMPLFLHLMHPAAKLSDQDKKTLCDWTETERTRSSEVTLAFQPSETGETDQRLKG